MNIYYITNARMPAERAQSFQIAKMCEAITQLGHQITLVVPRRLANSIKEPVHKHYELECRFPVKYLFVIDLLMFPKTFGVLAHWLAAVSFFCRALFIFPPRGTLIYTRSPEIAWLFGMRRYQTVCEIHDWPDSKIGLFLFLLKNVSLIPCNSRGTQSEFTSRSFMQTIVAPNGVDLNTFSQNVSKVEAREKLGLSLLNYVVMYIGTLEEWKGIYTLFEASKFLPPEFTVVAIGGSNQQVQVLSKKYPSVIFLGYKPYKELPLNQKAADVLVVPNSPASKESEKYTSPIKIFAHLTADAPMVVSDLTSVREILSEEVVWFFDPASPHDLANTIVRAIEDRHGSLQRVRNANILSKEYTWLKRASNILNHLEYGKC